MSNVPSTNTPAEVLQISPESLEIANCYLQTQDINIVADSLAVPTSLVTQTLARRDVKAYIDGVFMNTGFNNQFRMRSAMDALIKKKFQDLEEADVGSSKDILEILALSHKMSMEYLDKQLAVEKAHEANIKSQVNVQINESGVGGGTRYGNLIQQLIDSGA